MFYHLNLKHEISLHPKYLGPNIIETIKAKLLSEVEGICSSSYGYIIAVTSIDKIGDGIVQQGRGFTQIPIEYKAIIFRPFIGEVLDAVVTSVTKIGIFASAGAFSIFISTFAVPQIFSYDGDSVPPCYKTEEDDQVIQEDDEIRLRLVGMRPDNASGMLGVGTLIDDYLGLTN